MAKKLLAYVKENPFKTLLALSAAGGVCYAAVALIGVANLLYPVICAVKATGLALCHPSTNMVLWCVTLYIMKRCKFTTVGTRGAALFSLLIYVKNATCFVEATMAGISSATAGYNAATSLANLNTSAESAMSAISKSGITPPHGVDPRILNETCSKANFDGVEQCLLNYDAIKTKLDATDEYTWALFTRLAEQKTRRNEAMATFEKVESTH